jgi:hypothetical protein
MDRSPVHHDFLGGLTGRPLADESTSVPRISGVRPAKGRAPRSSRCSEAPSPGVARRFVRAGAAEILIAVADSLATTSARPAGCALGIPRLRKSAPDLSRDAAGSGHSAVPSHPRSALSGRGAPG